MVEVCASFVSIDDNLNATMRDMIDKGRQVTENVLSMLRERETAKETSL